MSPLLVRARETLKIEIAGLEGLIERLGPEFEEAVNLTLCLSGKNYPGRNGKKWFDCPKNSSHSHQYRNASTFFYMQEKVLTVIWE